MELLFKEENPSTLEMKNAHNMMLEVFADMVRLENFFGPVQMGVWVLEYIYLSEKYKIRLESERGFITIKVRNDKGDIFYPSLIYIEAEYFHFADKEKDVFQLIALTKKAITENEIVFLSNEEIARRNKRKMEEMYKKKKLRFREK